MEQWTFEVVNFRMVYNALLGRPQLVQFMGVPHYTYMMLKIPGPKGVIMVRGSLEHAVDCDRQNYDLGARLAEDRSNIPGSKRLREVATSDQVKQQLGPSTSGP